nr:hypothetical protein BaRGS_003724 [Batillaria attramentaria]
MAPGKFHTNGDTTNHAKPANYYPVEDDVGEDYDPECGIGSFRPPILQRCANMTVFTGVYSFSALLTSTLSSYVNSQV